MNKWDNLYNILNQANEQRKQENFNAFMNGFEAGLIKDLNAAYASGDSSKYEALLNNVKTKTGARVFRDSKGLHKLQFI